MFKLGLIINPFAGIGGRVGLKGSDGIEIREKALAMGALKLAESKTEICLRELLSVKDSLMIYTVYGEMGQFLCDKLELPYQIIHQAKQPSTDQDTLSAVNCLIAEKVELILFAGGDGTARNIFEACEKNHCEEQQMVLGIPAGVKIHSGVYAISPQAAGLLVKNLVDGKILSLLSADVMDIDENAFREGLVKAKKYGYLNVPGALEYVQAVKSGGNEVEAMVLDDIAAEVIDNMENDIYYVIGSGSTCAVLMQHLGLTNTLLGSDIVLNGKLFKSDAIERDFLDLLAARKQLRFIITVIGGQGHILGRGNHQISPQVINKVGWSNFKIIATKTKLKALEGKPLLVDSGDRELDQQLKGTKKVITGYRDFVVYPVGFNLHE